MRWAEIIDQLYPPRGVDPGVEACASAGTAGKNLAHGAGGIGANQTQLADVANATSHALVSFPANAGTASALAGTLRFGIGALAGLVVNSFTATSPLPMAAAWPVAAC